MSDISNQYDLGNPGSGDNYVSPSQVYEDTQVNADNNSPSGLPWSSYIADTRTDTSGGVARTASTTTAASGATAAANAAQAGISPDDFVLDPATGELYGFKRTIELEPGTNKTIYGYQTLDLGNSSNLATISTNTGIPAGVLQTKVAQLQVQNAQTKAQGYGKLIGFDPTTGLFSYQKPDGTRATTSNISDLSGVGIQPSEIRDSQAQAGQTTRTLTQMGQYTVAGMMPDGSLQVRDFNGTLSTFTAQQAAAGQIPGVSYSDFQRAQSEFATNQRTITQAGQKTANDAFVGPDGQMHVVVRDFNNNIVGTPTLAQAMQQLQAGQLPGVDPSSIYNAAYHAQDLAWQLSPVNTSAQNAMPYFANGYGNAPTTPPVTPSPAPSPTPNSRGGLPPGADPGATPNPLPSYRATPSIPPGTSNPLPTPPGRAATAPMTEQSSSSAPFSSTQGSPSTMPALSSQQQASYNAYTSTPSTPGGTSGTYASTPSVPGVVTHQQQQQNNQAYQQNLTQTTATNAGQSRNLSGMGWSGLQQPRVAGY